MTASMKAASNPPEKLLGEFVEPSYGDWRKLVESELKGAVFDKKMYTETYEGIKLHPIYRSEDVSGLPHVNSRDSHRSFEDRTPAAT